MASPKPHIKKDSFLHTICPSSSSTNPKHTPVTLYFISGNPGLISYYHPFLSLLSQKLQPHQHNDQNQNQAFQIAGHSLAGFELEGFSGPASGPSIEERPEGEHYYDLEEQIQSVQRRLEELMCLSTLRFGHGESPRPKVILIGHSVGTYIAMEILRRHREAQAPSKTKSRDQGGSSDFDIIGGIMLFPTVLDIAKSPSGVKLTFLLRLIPQLALVVAFFARILTSLLPDFLLRGIVRTVMKAPPENAVDATAEFLRSQRGIRQALHMAADEMRTITSDKWSDDVWGIASPEGKAKTQPESESVQQTQMFFYFGRNDHWVAEQTRDEIVAARGAKRKHNQAGTGPRMIVCEEAVPHAFCLRHNETMASKVADMVREILE